VGLFAFGIFFTPLQRWASSLLEVFAAAAGPNGSLPMILRSYSGMQHSPIRWGVYPDFDLISSRTRIF
jgi:hypothetical protein